MSEASEPERSSGGSSRGLAPRPPRISGTPWAVAAALLAGLLALGLVFGLFAAFAHGVRAGGLPVGLVLTLAGLGALLVAAGVVVGRRGAVGAVFGGWVVSVLILSQPRSEGDLVIAADGSGYGYLLGGLVLAGCASALPYPRLARR